MEEALYAGEVTVNDFPQLVIDCGFSHHAYALVEQLPRTPFSFRPDVAARQLMADGLRAVAARLDPCLSCEPSMVVVARPR